MKRNVVRLPGIAAPRARIPQESVVALLADLLKRAKRGEVAGIACAWVTSEEACEAHWATGSASANMMVSATSQLNFAVLETNRNG